MPYVKLDDMFWDNEKVDEAGFDGAGLYVMCLSMSGHFLTDGFVSDRRLKQLGASKRVIEKVTKAGLWVRKGDGFVIPDYTTLNYSKAEVTHHRKKEAERKRLERMRKAGLSDPDSDPDSTTDGGKDSDPESGDPKPYLSLPNDSLGVSGKRPVHIWQEGDKPPDLSFITGGTT